MSWSGIKHYDLHFYTPSSFENRTHKLCKLSNGLLVLLISDPTDNSSGCSLTVATGSHNDPTEIPGLAHLCEHMILAAGSKGYPDPGTYHEMIAKANGSQNAYTTGEQTSFYFELPSFHNSDEISFVEAMHIFSSFFIEPLFHPNMINKEIYAIESEHKGNISSASKIFYHATRLLANREHPFHRFSTGNMSTLKGMSQAQGLDLRDELQDYFDENYTSLKMTLCIRGPQSLNILTKMAVAEFGAIPMYRHTRRKILRSVKPSIKSPKKSPVKSKLYSPIAEGEEEIYNMKILEDSLKETYGNHLCFDRNEKHNTIFVKSHKRPQARIFFPVNSKSTRFTRKDVLIFSQFWYEIFGDESEGSFCHYLMEKGWATGCYAFMSEFATNNIGLVIELSLTNIGWKEISSILEIIISVLIPLFTEKDTMDLSKFLSDQYGIDIMRFIYKPTEHSPMEECASLSSLLQENLGAIDPLCIFKGSPMIVQNPSNSMSFFRENKRSETWWIGLAIKFQSFLKEFITTGNMRLILLGNLEACSLFQHIVPQKTVKYILKTDSAYEFEYLEDSWDFSIIKGNTSSIYDFHFPSENPYKPSWAKCYTNLHKILTSSSDKSHSASLRFAINNDYLQTNPMLVSKNDLHEMWILSYDAPNFPNLKSIVSIDVLSLQMEPSPENTMNLEILIQILFVTLSSKLYPATKLGYSYELGCSSKGDVTISLTMSGFSVGLKSLLVAIISTIRRIAIDSTYPSNELLRRARILVRNAYEDAAGGNCAKVASVGLLILLEKNMWTFEERMEALEDVDMQGLKRFCECFINGPKHLNLFVEGDISCADELNSYLNESFTYHFRRDLVGQPEQKPFASTRVLEPGTNAYVQRSGQQDDPNNSVVYFIQTGKRNDIQNVSLSAFTEYLLSFSIVSELRNKRQIGYLVIGGLRLLSDTVGLHITVMSAGPCMSLENHIDEYFAYMEAKLLSELTEDHFLQDYVKPYIKLYESNCIDKLQKLAGPADLLNEIVANLQNGDSYVLNSKTMKRHKKLKNHILSREHSFCKGEASVDLSFISRLTLPQFREFFEQKISIYSKRRSKISVMITSPMNDDELANRRLAAQLEFFLKMKGLVIESDEINRIVENSHGKPTLLMKNLYQSFKSKNESWKLCCTVLREIGRMTWHSLKYSRTVSSEGTVQPWNELAQPAISLKLIDNIGVYKSI